MTQSTRDGGLLPGDRNGVCDIGFTPDATEASMFLDAFEISPIARLPLPDA